MSSTEDSCRPTDSAKGSDEWIREIGDPIVIVLGVRIAREWDEVLSLELYSARVRTGRRYVGLCNDKSNSVFGVKRNTWRAPLPNLGLHCHGPVGGIAK